MAMESTQASNFPTPQTAFVSMLHDRKTRISSTNQNTGIRNSDQILMEEDQHVGKVVTSVNGHRVNTYNITNHHNNTPPKGRQKIYEGSPSRQRLLSSTSMTSSGVVSAVLVQPHVDGTATDTENAPVPYGTNILVEPTTMLQVVIQDCGLTANYADKDVLADSTNDGRTRVAVSNNSKSNSNIIKDPLTNVMMNGVRSGSTGNISTTGSFSPSTGTSPLLPHPSLPSQRSKLSPNESTKPIGTAPVAFNGSFSRSYEDVAIFSISPNTLKDAPPQASNNRQNTTAKNPWQISPQRDDVDPNENKFNHITTTDSIGQTQPPPSQQQEQEPLQQELIVLRSDPEQQDQALFESRLMEDPFGVAIRKINHSGKPQLRYVKCIPLSSAPYMASSSSARKNSSVASSTASSVLSRRKAKREEKNKKIEAIIDDNNEHYNLLSSALSKRRKALTWGQKNKVVVAYEKFVCVRKGKTTERTRKCPSPSCQLLSVITDNRDIVLDIEAPTKNDRDKFAQAFARFLCVPLEAEMDSSLTLDGIHTYSSTPTEKKTISSAQSAPLPRWNSVSSFQFPILKEEGNELGESISTSQDKVVAAASADSQINPSTTPRPKEVQETVDMPVVQKQTAVVSSSISTPNESSNVNIQNNSNDKEGGDESSQHSSVSSITAGLEQEIVDELHHVIQELRAELEASRAEAARAVKVAEQAIQSAENCSSKDWNSTVTHKAAEAAAQAQKRSAEAMARQRLAEEKLASEKRLTAFWKRQAEAAEEEAGALQTRAAAAEVQRTRAQHMLQIERELIEEQLGLVKGNLISTGVRQKKELEGLREKNRAMEIHIERTRLELGMHREENKALIEQLKQLKLSSQESVGAGKKKLKLGKIVGKKKSKFLDQDSDCSMSVEPGNLCLLSENTPTRPPWLKGDLLTAQIRRETMELRDQFDLFRATISDELKSLPNEADEWIAQVTQALLAAQSETNRVRERLAKESAMRRRLAHKVQDQRGTVRVYCRPRPSTFNNPIVTVPSDGTVVICQEKIPDTKTYNGNNMGADNTDGLIQLGFEFDRVFDPHCSQSDVYEEVESLVMDALDGYSVCIMAYGQTKSGKTYTLLGDIGQPLINNKTVGVHLNAVNHLFAVAETRSERYQDAFSITIVEIQEDRLFDLIAGTRAAVQFGEPVSAEAPLSKKKSRSRRRSSEDPDSPNATLAQQNKLEIKTNFDGDTVVQGLTSVPITCPQDAIDLWNECLKQRGARLAEQGKTLDSHLAKSHVFFTLSVVSTNIATGVTSAGKMQFVDLAGSDLVSGQNHVNNNKTRDKSLTTLSEVVEAKCQFLRTVPYRNSTLTHLLRDSFEGDTKVLMICCISSDAEDAQHTKEALRFATRMRRVSVGIATKRTTSPADAQP